MSARHDPELDDVLRDMELRRLAQLLSSAHRPEPPLDEAFRSDLRRQLMQQAWEMSDGGPSLWHRLFAPPRLAWVGATAGMLLIAAVVVYSVVQPSSQFDIKVQSQMDGRNAVALRQPILVSFNQPMDHPSTEAAVQIMPATNVTYSWQVNTLAVQPSSGNLAPNTQYQVTIGPGAKTAQGKPLAAAQTITFVTEPPASPTPTPTPTPRATASPASLLTGERLLAPLGGVTSTAMQWSADSSILYFVSGQGALEVVSAKGGEVKLVAPDGASSPAIAPAGDRLAYIRSGKIEILTFATGTTAELVVKPAATLVGWAKDQLEWATADGVYTQVSRPIRLASIPGLSLLSIAPDGTRAVVSQDQRLFLLNQQCLVDPTLGCLSGTANTTQLGQAGAVFYGWSPSGAKLLYTSGDALVVTDQKGNSVGTLPSAEASWSTQDAILLGSDTDLSQVRPDGSAATKLASGTYHQPLWAPNGTAFAFFRGGSLWTASAPLLPPMPSTLDLASVVINSFMQARQRGQAEQATAFLDENGRQAYTRGSLSLLIGGDPRFSRFYVLTQGITSTQPETATFVVRLVLTHGKLDVADFEETLNVIRDPTTKLFVIDQATAGAHRDLGKGASVVGVVVKAGTIQVTFDSDLDPGTVPDGVMLLDSKGNKVDASTTYLNRTVTISGLALKAGAKYKLVVLTTVRDVLGHNVASEYNLLLSGPAVQNQGDNKNAGNVSASPTPTPTGSQG
jgi:hypothetical protein